jgi:hypothetical protein
MLILKCVYRIALKGRNLIAQAEGLGNLLYASFSGSPEGARYTAFRTFVQLFL